MYDPCMSCMQLPDVCIESEVLAKYILEVKNLTGFVILETIEDYQHSRLIEVILTLEESGSYTVNVTVYIPLYADLGSHTIIKEFSKLWLHTKSHIFTCKITFSNLNSRQKRLLLKLYTDISVACFTAETNSYR